MSESPIRRTIDEMVGKLGAAIVTRADADRKFTEYTNAIRALAKVMEDKEAADSVLATLDELNGKPGFLDAIRTAFRVSKKGLTPTEVRAWIRMGNKLDLTAYSNPLASIHTTLRRMEDNGEIESFTNEAGEKAYRPVVKSITELKREAEERDPRKNSFVGPKTRELQNLRAKALIDKHLAKKD
jgi:hypothetical protein